MMTARVSFADPYCGAWAVDVRARPSTIASTDGERKWQAKGARVLEGLGSTAPLRLVGARDRQCRSPGNGVYRPANEDALAHCGEPSGATRGPRKRPETHPCGVAFAMPDNHPYRAATTPKEARRGGL